MASARDAPGIEGGADEVGVGRFTSLKRAVFFDRDGVLNAAIVRNGRPHPPSSLAELAIDPSAAVLLGRLKLLGFVIVVVTNQPDVARGTTTRDVVEAMNARIHAELPIDAIFTCYHDRDDDCACRKPRPGMIEAAAADFGLDLAASYLVGDRWSDIAAGRSVSVRSVFIDRGYDEPAPELPEISVATLAAACGWIEAQVATLSGLPVTFEV